MVLIVKCLICNKKLTYTQYDPSELITHVKREHPLVGLKTKRKFSENKRDSEDKVTKNWRQSLEFNADVLNALIDREAQTEVDWKFFVNMEEQVLLSKRGSNSSTKSQDKVMEILSPPKKASSHLKLDSKIRKKSGEIDPLETSIESTSKGLKKEKLSNEIEMKVGKSLKVLYNRDKNPPKSHKLPQSERQRSKFYKTSIEKWRPVGDEKIHCPRCESHKRPIVRTHTERVTQSSFASTLLMTCWPICFAPCLFPEPIRENLHCPVCNYHLGVYDHQAKSVLSNSNLTSTIQ